MTASPRGPRRRKWDGPSGRVGAWIAETDFGTAPAVTAALHAAVDDGFLTYLPDSTAREAEAACAGFLARRHGWEVDPELVHLVPDVLTALRLAIDLYTPPGSAVIVPTPCYMPFLDVPRRAGRRIVPVPSIPTGGRWRMDLAGIERALADGAGMLILCDPHNPLGQLTGEDEKAAIEALVAAHGARVFVDEIHAPVVYPGGVHRPYAARSAVAAGHAITATATSKGWNVPGLKAAQLVLTNDADERRWRAADPVPRQSGSILGAVAAIAAYRDGVEWLDGAIARLDANRRLVAELIERHVPAIGYRIPEATYLAWLDLRALELGDDPLGFLADQAGVVVTDGTLCGAGGEGFVRFNFGTEPELIELAFRAVARVLPGDRGR